ncbi:hypothetical protein SLEP1_g58736 [Rubroshorea leprosula]|uniref:Uncharacterized protein n=1 Tax=Rubroshorea leprosula TaxID=152421 RepID=A0AAV5MRB4_9ROSI|nr:hypothetical protein SLEP1_g58736 [Rubroshorea leprosula]
MWASDAPRSDVERRELVSRSARGADQCGLWRRPKPGLSRHQRRRRRRYRGQQHALSQCASAPACSRRQPGGSPFDPS